MNPQDPVYEGMIIGEHARDNDLEVNPLKGKKLTNIRASGSDEAVRLTPPVQMSLEQAIAYIDDDELVEVTPSAFRLRKRHLDPHERKRQSGRQADGGGGGAAPRPFRAPPKYLCSKEKIRAARGGPCRPLPFAGGEDVCAPAAVAAQGIVSAGAEGGFHARAGAQGMVMRITARRCGG